MVLEYLLSGNEQREKFEEIIRKIYKDSEKEIKKVETIDKESEEIQYKIFNIKNSSFFIGTVFLKGNNQKSANILNNVNKQVLKNFTDIIILKNECSEYYNQKLYLMINKFEHNLRKLLCIGLMLEGKESAREEIKRFESMYIIGLLKIMFVDREFENAARKLLENEKKENPAKFTKKNLIKILENFEENILWNNLPGSGSITSFEDKIIDINYYRNHVMHAHSIDLDDYKKGSKLFTDVNTKLEKLIDHINEEREAERREVSNIISKQVMLNLQSTMDSLSEALNPVFMIDAVNDKLASFIQNFKNASFDYPLDNIQNTFKKLAKLSYLSEIGTLKNNEEADKE